MARPRILSPASFLALAALPGCTHNHYYYGGSTVCDPAPAVVQYGEVCEVPAPSRGAVVVSAAPGGQQMLVSRPQGRPRARLAWRRPDPESLATTRVDGGLDDPAIR